MAKRARAIEKSLDLRADYKSRELSLPRDCASKYAALLATWLDDMIFIAESERPKRGRPPATD